MVWNGNGCQAEILIQWINCYQIQLGWIRVGGCRNFSKGPSPSVSLRKLFSLWFCQIAVLLHTIWLKFMSAEQFHLEWKWKKKPKNLGTSLHIPWMQFNLTCLSVYFTLKTEKGSFPVLYHSIRELCHSKFSHFHFINLLITKKNAWTPW